MLYDPNFYTLDDIPKYRQEFIDLKIKYLIDKYSITYPLDTVKLIKKIKEEANVILITKAVRFNSPSTFEAEAKYNFYYNAYTLIYNIDKVHYPFKKSKDRRLNFTIAHEIAHIVLGHLKIPNPTDEERRLFELEADEFTARLLLPKGTLLDSVYLLGTSDKIADYFMVSSRALWRRFNNLKLLELLYDSPNYVKDENSTEVIFNLQMPDDSFYTDYDVDSFFAGF